jgi:AraC family transcriptional regulator
VKPSLGPGSYYGQTAKCREMAALILTESFYPQDTDIPTHCHENAFFYLVVQGNCQERSGGRERIIEPASLVFHPAQEPHANRWIGTEGRCFHVEFGVGWRQRLEEQGLKLECPTEHRGGLPTWFASRLYHEFQHPDEASSLAMEGLTLELLAEVVRTPRMIHTPLPPRWLGQAREILHDRFTDSLDVETIARTVNVHPSHLVRAFRQQYGCTMGDYIRSLRVEFACRQLSVSDASLADIALNAGFSDQSHFCKTFKRLTGLTPAQYQHHFRIRKSPTRV